MYIPPRAGRAAGSGDDVRAHGLLRARAAHRPGRGEHRRQHRVDHPRQGRGQVQHSGGRLLRRGGRLRDLHRHGLPRTAGHRRVHVPTGHRLAGRRGFRHRLRGHPRGLPGLRQGRHRRRRPLPPERGRGVRGGAARGAVLLLAGGHARGGGRGGAVARGRGARLQDRHAARVRLGEHRPEHRRRRRHGAHRGDDRRGRHGLRRRVLRDGHGRGLRRRRLRQPLAGVL